MIARKLTGTWPSPRRGGRTPSSPFWLTAALSISCSGAPLPKHMEGTSQAPTEASEKRPRSAEEPHSNTGTQRPPPQEVAGAQGPPALLPLPEGTTELSLLALGSCQDARSRIAALRAITELPRAAAAKASRSKGPDLMVYLGDNVYGDDPSSSTLERLEQEYQRLASHADFLWLTARVPLLATWDDHDFGRNDGGGDFPAKQQAEALFERFFGTHGGLADHPGVYSAHRFGPEGRTVQLILLDTRFDRSPLLRGRPGEARYVPNSDPMARMLSEAQWSWLAKELEKPAEVRVIISSIQVLPEHHGFEAWNKLPLERERLLALIEQSEGEALLVSGDRHIGAIYTHTRKDGRKLWELTTSSLNRRKTELEKETGELQVTRAFTENNFGSIAFDWAARTVKLRLHGVSGRRLASVSLQLSKGEPQGTD